VVIMLCFCAFLKIYWSNPHRKFLEKIRFLKIMKKMSHKQKIIHFCGGKSTNMTKIATNTNSLYNKRIKT